MNSCNWLHPHQIGPQRTIRCISPNPREFQWFNCNSCKRDTAKYGMHLSKSWAFSWFGCTHTKWGHNEKQDAFHRTLGCLMVWLHSYELRSWQKTKCISPNPRNSYGLVAVTPVDVTTNTNCISTNARIFCGVAAIMPNKATKRKQDACHHILGILLIWLHWR